MYERVAAVAPDDKARTRADTGAPRTLPAGRTRRPPAAPPLLPAERKENVTAFPILIPPADCAGAHRVPPHAPAAPGGVEGAGGRGFAAAAGGG